VIGVLEDQLIYKDTALMTSKDLSATLKESLDEMVGAGKVNNDRIGVLEKEAKERTVESDEMAKVEMYILQYIYLYIHIYIYIFICL
jgi:hypothetical protein